MSNIAFIPVRGGSKSIPLKNIKLLAGRPLVYWTAAAANNARCVDRVIIATDSDEIRAAVRTFANLKKVELYNRDAENATDTASTESVMLEYINKSNLKNDDMFFLIQATSPLLKSEHIDEMFAKMHRDGADSALSCVRNKRFFWGADGKSMNYDYCARPRRQDFEGMLMENGACYINSVGNILCNKNRLSGKISVYEMPEYTATEIDEPDDFLIIEKLMAKYNKPQLPTGKTFCFDIDGVLGLFADIKDMAGDYANNVPNIEMIEICNKLYDAGNKIVLHTARGSGSGIDWSDKTKAQLARWGVRYHALTFGKPAADFYIDDKMLSLERLRMMTKSR
ncbi:MAG: acylneuraminate cytidylyltransferase family protein [Alphaproteobacteria bacterium]|nr:acylneuraminate cytidylyltransferase family protein [Alphaproteobacteria bacterium]